MRPSSIAHIYMVVALLYNVEVVAWSKLSQLMVQPLSQTDMGGELREVLQVGQVWSTTLWDNLSISIQVWYLRFAWRYRFSLCTTLICTRQDVIFSSLWYQYVWQYVFSQVGQTLTPTIAVIVRIHNSSNIFHNFHNQFGRQEGFACWTTCLSRLGWSTYAHTPTPISLWHESSYCLATFSVPIFLLFGNSGPCHCKNYQPFSKVSKSSLRK